MRLYTQRQGFGITQEINENWQHMQTPVKIKN